MCIIRNWMISSWLHWSFWVFQYGVQDGVRETIDKTRVCSSKFMSDFLLQCLFFNVLKKSINPSKEDTEQFDAIYCITLYIYTNKLISKIANQMKRQLNKRICIGQFQLLLCIVCCTVTAIFHKLSWWTNTSRGETDELCNVKLDCRD